MKKLLLLLILSILSTQSFAKVEGVYYCETKSYSALSQRGFENYYTNNFKFKFEKDKFIFDSKFEPSFAERELPITFYGEKHFTIARSSNNHKPQYAIFSNGDFVYSYGSDGVVFTVIAVCDTF